jgi:hypothetical protein
MRKRRSGLRCAAAGKAVKSFPDDEVEVIGLALVVRFIEMTLDTCNA